MRRIVASALIALAVPLTVPLLAQLPKEPPGAPDISRITAGTYRINPEHSQVLFTVDHFGFSDYTGQFTRPAGTLTLDPAKPQDTKIDITIPIANVLTTVPALDAHLQKPEFFDAARFPTARFVSTKVDISGTKGFVAGRLTLRGVTHPVILAVRLIGAGQGMADHRTNVGFSATATIQRSDFGMTYLVPLVSDRVALAINAVFEAQ